MFVLALLLPLSVRAAGELRIWTSSDGKTVNAELVSATDTTVTIKTDAGREFTLAHERLSLADREVISAHLAKVRAETESIVWPRATAEEAIKAPYLKKLHAIDAKKFTATYAGRILQIEGQVTDVREDRLGPTQGVIVVLDTEDKIPMEFSFLKTSYEKDFSLLLGSAYNRYRGPYGEDELRVKVADKSLVVERRYVTSRESDYISGLDTWRYRNRWSSWEVIAKPLTRGDTLKLRGEFISVFNSIMSFKDASLATQDTSTTVRSINRF